MANFVRGVLSVPEANSRLAYLLWTLTMCAAFLMMVYAYIWKATPADRSQFETLMMLIGAGHVGGSLSRVATKWGDKIQGDQPYGK